VRYRLLAAVVLLGALLCWAVISWSNRVMTDPEDQCRDTDSPLVARLVVCMIERK
jgi:hypothetical protein